MLFLEVISWSIFSSILFQLVESKKQLPKEEKSLFSRIVLLLVLFSVTTFSKAASTPLLSNVTSRPTTENVRTTNILTIFP